VPGDSDWKGHHVREGEGRRGKKKIDIDIEREGKNRE
jgi:hypothetical protein